VASQQTDERAGGRTPKAAVGVANVLRRRIIGGDLAVGDSLPPEMRLVDELGVSRPTLRAALRILESEQLITVRRGSRGGAWVNAPTTSVLARRAGVFFQFHGVTLDEVHQARAAVEPPAARIVAQARDPKGIAQLEALVEEEERTTDDRDAFRSAGLRFHRTVVELAGNKTLIVLAAMIHGVIEQHASRYQPASRFRAGPARHQEHRQFLELVRAGDADQAERLWSEHLELARQDMLREGTVRSVVDLLS
jgi:GntR family transcriptional repressor for pyruvate dehydrogenase complex